MIMNYLYICEQIEQKFNFFLSQKYQQKINPQSHFWKNGQKFILVNSLVNNRKKYWRCDYIEGFV